MFEGIIQLQIDNGIEQLKTHKQSCPSNATYLSKASTAEFLDSISFHLVLDRLKRSKFYSIMADESTDISTKEELSICGRWLEDSGKIVEHFLGQVMFRKLMLKPLPNLCLSSLMIRIFHSKNYVD